MTKDELLSHIHDLSGIITAARNGLSKDEAVNLEGVDEKVRLACSAVSDLPPDEAVEVQPALRSLLEDLQHLSEELRDKISTLSGEAEAEESAAETDPGTPPENGDGA